MDAYTMPQPTTFAPSKEDVLNSLMFYLGSPVSPEKLKDYKDHHAATYHFPDAYVGQNTRIRDTLNNLILKSPQSWQTSIGLPFFQLDGVVVEWDGVLPLACTRSRVHLRSTLTPAPHASQRSSTTCA